jgi:predicted anti-sigma-YlaC factor YlaD
MSRADDLSCRELVELVTDYLEDAMPARERARFEVHLLACPPCVSYIDQLARIGEVLPELREEDLAPTMREDLLGAFRTWKRGARPAEC